MIILMLRRIDYSGLSVEALDRMAAEDRELGHTILGIVLVMAIVAAPLAAFSLA